MKRLFAAILCLCLLAGLRADRQHRQYLPGEGRLRRRRGVRRTREKPAQAPGANCFGSFSSGTVRRLCCWRKKAAAQGTFIHSRQQL